MSGLKVFLKEYKLTNYVSLLIEFLITLLNKKLRLIQSFNKINKQLKEPLNTKTTSKYPLFTIEEAELEESMLESSLVRKKSSTQSPIFDLKNEEYKDTFSMFLKLKAKSNTGKNNILSKRFSASIPILSEKPFDKTSGEDQMEKIFSEKIAQKIPSKSSSFELNIGILPEKIPDNRLSNSSMLDYSRQCVMKTTKNKTKCGSLNLDINNNREFQTSTFTDMGDFDLVKIIKPNRSALIKRRNNNEIYLMETFVLNKSIEYFQIPFAKMKQLTSKHLVKLHFMYSEKESTFFVSEHVNGTDLGTLLSNNGRINIKVQILLK